MEQILTKLVPFRFLHNVETTGGSIPGLVFVEADGHLRSSGTSYRVAWKL